MIDKHTEKLARTFEEISAPPLMQLKAYEARSDALAAQSDAAGCGRANESARSIRYPGLALQTDVGHPGAAQQGEGAASAVPAQPRQLARVRPAQYHEALETLASAWRSWRACWRNLRSGGNLAQSGSAFFARGAPPLATVAGTNHRPLDRGAGHRGFELHHRDQHFATSPGCSRPASRSTCKAYWCRSSDTSS